MKQFLMSLLRALFAGVVVVFFGAFAHVCAKAFMIGWRAMEDFLNWL